MVTPPAPVHTGRLLGGRYRVGPRLAGGGMAEVFLARDGRLDRDVAIKVLRPDKAADPADPPSVRDRGPGRGPPVASQRGRRL